MDHQESKMPQNGSVVQSQVIDTAQNQAHNDGEGEGLQSV